MQAHRFAMESLKKNAAQMKDRYDKQAWEPNLSPGDIVFVYMPRVKNQAVKLKLSKVYHGPFVIVKYHTATTVYLKDIRSGKFVLKPVAIGRLKKMGNNNIRTQEHVDQEAAEEEDPLEVGDIPLDSLIPDTRQQPDLNRAPPGQEAEPPVGQKDMVPPRDDMDGKGDWVSNGNQSDRAASAPLISEQMELPKQTTNPGGNRTSRRTPMGYRIHKGVKSDNLSPVESVLDVARIRDEMHVNPLDPRDHPSNMRYFPRISPNSLRISPKFRADIQIQSLTYTYLFIKTKLFLLNMKGCFISFNLIY